MDPKLFAQMNRQFGGMFGDLSEDQMKQAGNIWKMLDDMAATNPDGYKSFVDSNIKQGFEEMKQEKEKTIEEQKVQPQIGFLIKTQAQLKSQTLNKEEHKLFDKLVVNEDRIKEYHQFKSKQDKEVKFYINVLKHERVKGPLDEKGVPVKNPDDHRTWKEVPISVSSISSRKSNTYGYHVYFVDAIMNTHVYEFMNSNPQLQVSLIQFVRDRVQHEIKAGYNPLMNYYDPKEVNEILYYEFEKITLKRHTTKKYKPMEKNRKTPQKMLILVKYDIEGEKFIKKQAKQQESEDKAKEQYKNMKDGKPVNINDNTNNQVNPMAAPESLLQQINQNQQENNNNKFNSQDTEKVFDGLKLADKKPEKQVQKKPVVIQELSSTTNEQEEQQERIKQKMIDDNKKKQQEEELKLKQKKQKEQEQEEDNGIEKPEYQLEESEKEIKITINLPKIKSFKQVDLDISSVMLKLGSEEKIYDLSIKFPCSIDNDTVKAKWEKKSKCLKLTLEKF